MPVSIALVITLIVLGQPVLAQEYWDPSQCSETLLDLVEHLEKDVRDIEQLEQLLLEAQRKGEAERVAILEANLESQRVDGIKDKLRRIDGTEYVYCNKSLFDPALIARVDAVRPYAEKRDVVAPPVEAPPRLEFAAITSTFVPSDSVEGGTCEGPYLDLSIKIQNTGGVFPRPVDIDTRSKRFPGVSDKWTYLVVVLQFAYDNGETGQQQIDVYPADLNGGVIPAGGAIALPMRVRILDNRRHVTIAARMEAPQLAVAGDEPRSAVYTTEAAIPIWDLYTESTETVSGPDITDRAKIFAGVRATVVNRGGPTPGLVAGSFVVRRTLGGPSLASVSGTSLAPVAGAGLVLAGTHVPAVVTPPIIVESNLIPLCPDGSYGRLADGNIEDNKRVLEER
jgi:hypothetical protein